VVLCVLIWQHATGMGIYYGLGVPSDYGVSYFLGELAPLLCDVAHKRFPDLLGVEAVRLG
jgi:hypothetical protein